MVFIRDFQDMQGVDGLAFQAYKEGENVVSIIGHSLRV